MNTERLSFLANALRADAANPTGIKFDLGKWAEQAEGKFEQNCGTTACAMGLACLLSEFQAQGLHLSPGGSPRFEYYRKYEAAQHFFDIGYSQAEYLFCPTYYPLDARTGSVGELAVADRINALMDGTFISPPFYN